MQGALNDAARRAAVQDPHFTASGSTTEERVSNTILTQLGKIAPDATIDISQSNFYDFSGIGNPEKLMSDVNGNGAYDAGDGDCFADLNENGEFDTDAGREGIGGANDVVFYTAEITMPRLLPVAGLIGFSPNYEMSVSTAIRNQPYGTQKDPAGRLRDGVVKRSTLLARLARNEDGLAFVEFAFIGPILLFLTLAGLELVNYALAHLRVNQIATTVADNAGRVTTGIDEANIYEVFAGANAIGASMDFEANGRIVLSSLQDNGRNGANAGQMINWQRCWGDLAVEPAHGVEDDGRDDSSLEDGPGENGGITSVPGTAVMFVEVTYDYQPLISDTILPVSGQIRHESAFNVRGRQNNDLSNSQSLPENAC